MSCSLREMPCINLFSALPCSHFYLSLFVTLRTLCYPPSTNNHSRGGHRILANKTQLQASIPPSKRPRREGVLRYLRQHAPQMIPPPPPVEPECLWAMPTNLLQVCFCVEKCEVGRVDVVWVCWCVC